MTDLNSLTLTSTNVPYSLGIDASGNMMNKPYNIPYTVDLNGTLGSNTIITPNSSFESYSFGILDVQRSTLEKLLDELFTPQEKVDFLEGLGYIVTVSGVYKKSDKVDEDPNNSNIPSYPSLGDAFLREITIKFKNLLLSRQVLKLKL